MVQLLQTTSVSVVEDNVAAGVEHPTFVPAHNHQGNLTPDGSVYGAKVLPYVERNCKEKRNML